MPLLTMPWGKYKGTPVDELSDDYLWLANHNFTVQEPVLREALREELDDRIQTGIYKGRWTSSPEEEIELSAPQLLALTSLAKSARNEPTMYVIRPMTYKWLRTKGFAVASSDGVHYITEKGKAALALQRPMIPACR